MRFHKTGAITSVLLFATSLSASTPKVRRGPTAPRVYKGAQKPKTAQGIDPERATQIQTALIKAGYLTGTPSGTWDATTQAAMEKLQSDNGWQTKLVPDARAIIKLGLGSSTTPATVVVGSQPEEPETPATPEASPLSALSSK